MEKRALLIGINYIGTKESLAGCINDVMNTKFMLLTQGYKEENILILTDKSFYKPTCENIRKGWRWLLSAAKERNFADKLYIKNNNPTQYYFHYSGH